MSAAAGGATLSQAIQVGRLVSLDWKLGVSIKSNHCSKLTAPFVTIFLRMADSDSKIKSHSFELSMAEFQEFSKQFNAMNTVMETL